jgi:hypothetical protein
MPQKRKEDFDEADNLSSVKKTRKNELNDICQSIYDSLRGFETTSNDVNRSLCEHFLKLPQKKYELVLISKFLIFDRFN